MRIVLLGPPGAGKGTQATAIASAHGIPHIATGDIFRTNVSEGTPLGEEAKAFMDRGDLVPDELVIAMVAQRLREVDARDGFLLDGFPRTVPQALALEEELAAEGTPLDCVLRFIVPDDEVIARIASRRMREGRSDDGEAVLRNRLAQYRMKTEPLEAFYAERGLLRDLNGVGSVEEVAARAEQGLSEVAAR